MPPLTNALQSLGPASVQPLQPNSGFFGDLSQFFFGQRPQQISQPRFTPEQTNILSQLGQQGLQGLNQFDFSGIADEARRGFQEQTAPSIAQRYASSGGLSSSGFERQLAQAGSNLEGQLAALKSQFQQQSQPNILRMLGLFAQPQYDQAITKGSGGLLGSLLGTEAGTKAAISGSGKAGNALGSAFMQVLPYLASLA